MKKERIHMKKRALALLMTLCMLFGMLPTAMAATEDFKDVKQGDWCYDYVDFVVDNGYFNGTTKTTFSPDNTMTRQQFVTVLARMAGVKVDNSKSAFTDVPVNTYSTGSVAWAAKEGIVTGYADGTFKPTAPVTRQQMCAFMSRFMDYYAEEYGVAFLRKGKVLNFTDGDMIADYAEDAVERCCRYGLVQGYEDGSFRPTANSKRSHVAAVIYRLALAIEAVVGGGGGFIPGPTTYTYKLTYKDTNVASGAAPVETTYTVTTTDTSYAFPIGKDPNDALAVAADPTDTLADGVDKVFLNWTDGTNTYNANDPATGTITFEAPADGVTTTVEKVLTSTWADKNDLLFLAIGNTATYFNGVATPKASAVSNTAPYIDLGTIAMAAPEAIDDNSTTAVADDFRNVNLTASGELSADIYTDMIETAVYYAVRVVGEVMPTDNDNIMTKTEVEDLVVDLLKILDPAKTAADWWDGAKLTNRAKNLAAEIYDSLKTQGKDHGSTVWGYYKVSGKPIMSAVSIKDGATTLAVAKADKKLYEANGTTALSYKRGVARVAEAAAKQLVANLKADYTSATEYFFDVTLKGTLTLAFTMSDETVTVGGTTAPISTITAGYPTIYKAKVVLDLSQDGDVLGYRYYNGENYVKLVVTQAMQDEYAEGVDAIAKSAMTNKTLKTELTKIMKDELTKVVKSSDPTMDNLMTQLVAQDAYLAADVSTKAKAQEYVLNKLLKPEGSSPVDMWIAANLSTVERGGLDYPVNADFYLPFDFFWNQNGTLDAAGNLYVNGVATTKAFGDNSDLVDAIEVLINDVVNSVAADVFAEYGVTDITGDGVVSASDINDAVVENLMNDKMDDILNAPHTVGSTTYPTFRNYVVTTMESAAQTNVDFFKTSLRNDLGKPAYMYKTGLTDWDSKSAAQKDAWMAANLIDVDATMVELFGVSDPAAIRVANIDMAAAYSYTTADLADPTPAEYTDQARLKRFIKGNIAQTINVVIESQVVGNLNSLRAKDADISTLLDAGYAEMYVTYVLMNKIGLTTAYDPTTEAVSGGMLDDVAISNMVPVAKNIINTKIAAERAALGLSTEEVEDLLNENVAKAAGTFSAALNEVSTIKTFEQVAAVPAQKLINILKHEAVLSMADENVAPKYVQAIAKAITKLETNPSTITVDGKEISSTASKVQAVKTASESGNARALCLAVANFLSDWGTLSINSFAPDAVNPDNDGIEVSANLTARGYTFSETVNFVIEVQ